MARTEVRSKQIKDGGVKREDLNVDIPGRAVTTRIIAGDNVSITSTGVDSGTGDVTINSTGNGGGDGGITASSTVFIVPPPTNDYWVGTLQSTATTTNSFGINAIRCTPFVSPYDFLIDQICFWCSAVTAGAVARVVIYGADPDNGRPTSEPLAITSELVLGAGINIYALDFTFEKNKLYWIGIWSGVALATIRVGNTQTAFSLVWNNSLNVRQALVHNTTYHATNNPTSWTFSKSNFTAIPTPLIGMRKSFP